MGFDDVDRMHRPRRPVQLECVVCGTTSGVSSRQISTVTTDPLCDSCVGGWLTERVRESVAQCTGPRAPPVVHLQDRMPVTHWRDLVEQSSGLALDVLAEECDMWRRLGESDDALRRRLLGGQG